MSHFTTLGEFIIDRQKDFPGSSGELSRILSAIRLASKIVNQEINKAGVATDILGAAGSENIQGEQQQKLDVYADEKFIKAIEARGVVCGIGSEENDDYIAYESEKCQNGKYVLLMDPLDGSSNIDVNVSIGTIFSVFKRKSEIGTKAELKDFLQIGDEQVAAGYVLYGPSTLLVITTGQGVDIFTLDPDTKEFVLTEAQSQITPTTKEFAINMSNQRFWAQPMQNYVADLIQGEEGPLEKRYNMRWVAAMVADVHRIINRGGIFMYPWDKREPGKPGKLRLMYEGNPMAMLVEQAGGLATNAEIAILVIQPELIHQRVPVILGSKEEVNVALSYFK